MVWGNCMRNEKNAKDLRYEAVTVLGHGMLFTTAYLDPNTIPKGVYLYAVRHHSEDPEKPIQLSAWAVVNRYGTLLSTTPIHLQHHPKLNNSFKNIDPDRDWENRGYFVKLHEYLEHYPIQKTRSYGQER